MISDANSCCFIGHSTIYKREKVREEVYITVNELIKSGIKTFYNGGMGQFDVLCADVVHELKKSYNHILNILIVPYPKVDSYKAKLFDDVIYPSLEKYHPKIAIIKRNEIMVNKVQYAVSYVTHGWGGAAMTFEYARKKGVHIIDVSGACYFDANI